MLFIAPVLLGALALLSFVGISYPLDMLPLMLFELAWKTCWLIVIALPAQLNDRWTPGIESEFYELIGVVLIYVVMPWRYVWAGFFKQSSEAWLPAPCDD